MTTPATRIRKARATARAAKRLALRSGLSPLTADGLGRMAARLTHAGRSDGYCSVASIVDEELRYRSMEESA